MAKHFSKKYGNKGCCQDACQCLMLHPYIKRGCKVYVISFLYSKCSTFEAAWVCLKSISVLSGCLSMPDIPTSLPQKQVAKIKCFQL